jgi:hypothetical protein
LDHRDNIALLKHNVRLLKESVQPGTFSASPDKTVDKDQEPTGPNTQTDNLIPK